MNKFLCTVVLLITPILIVSRRCTVTKLISFINANMYFLAWRVGHCLRHLSFLLKLRGKAVADTF